MVMIKQVLLAFCVLSAFVEADKCVEARTDKEKCVKLGAQCIWTGFACVSADATSSPTSRKVASITDRFQAAQLASSKGAISSKVCKQQGTAKFNGLFGDGYISRPKCVEAAGCCYCTPNKAKASHQDIKCVNKAETINLKRKDEYDCACSVLHLNGGKIIPFDTEDVRVAYTMPASHEIKAFEEGGSEAEFIGLFDRSPDAVQPPATVESTPVFTQQGSALKSTIESGLVRKHTGTGFVVLSMKGNKLAKAREFKLDKGHEFELRVCKVKVLNPDHVEVHKVKEEGLKDYTVYGCRKTCDNKGPDDTECLQTQVLRTTRCKRKAVTKFKSLYSSFMSAGDQLLADAKLASKEFTELADDVKQKYSQTQFDEDMGNAAAFALYVGNKNCIPKEHAEGVSDDSQVCDGDTQEGLLDMGKKLQEFVISCPIASWTPQARKIATQELPGDEYAVRIMRMTESLTALLDPERHRADPEYDAPCLKQNCGSDVNKCMSDQTCIAFTKCADKCKTVAKDSEVSAQSNGKMCTDKCKTQSNGNKVVDALLMCGSEKNCFKTMSRFKTDPPMDEPVEIIIDEDERIEDDNNDIARLLTDAIVAEEQEASGKASSARQPDDPSTFLQMALLQVAELEGASTSTKMLVKKGWWSSMLSGIKKITSAVVSAAKDKFSDIHDTCVRMATKAKTAYNKAVALAKAAAKAVADAAIAAAKAVKDKAAKAYLTAKCAVLFPAQAAKATWKWVKDNKYALMKAAVGMSCFVATVATAGAAAPACLAIGIAVSSVVTVMEDCIPTKENGGLIAASKAAAVPSSESGPESPFADSPDASPVASQVTESTIQVPDTCNWNTLYKVGANAAVTVASSFIPGASVLGEAGETLVKIGAGGLGALIKEGGNIVQCVSAAKKAGESKTKCVKGAVVTALVGATVGGLDELAGDVSEAMNAEAGGENLISEVVTQGSKAAIGAAAKEEKHALEKGLGIDETASSAEEIEADDKYGRCMSGKTNEEEMSKKQKLAVEKLAAKLKEEELEKQNAKVAKEKLKKAKSDAERKDLNKKAAAAKKQKIKVLQKEKGLEKLEDYKLKHRACEYTAGCEARTLYFEWSNEGSIAYGSNHRKVKQVTRDVYNNNYKSYPEKWNTVSPRLSSLKFVDLAGEETEFVGVDSVAGQYDIAVLTSGTWSNYMYEKRMVSSNNGYTNKRTNRKRPIAIMSCHPEVYGQGVGHTVSRGCKTRETEAETNGPGSLRVACPVRTAANGPCAADRWCCGGKFCGSKNVQSLGYRPGWTENYGSVDWTGCAYPECQERADKKYGDRPSYCGPFPTLDRLRYRDNNGCVNNC